MKPPCYVREYSALRLIRCGVIHTIDFLYHVNRPLADIASFDLVILVFCFYHIVVPWRVIDNDHRLISAQYGK